jgi:hypothetical protein
MVAPARASLIEHFAVLEDPRQAGKVLYPLPEIGVWGAVERKSYVGLGSSVPSPVVSGSRSGRSSPRATGSGKVKA